ncbi:uncharacterized protein G2W53_001115 [Senna tora]|uniref:Uncharacterized protein n=1 Tax=Senna tora TaxID=362788 RepID=A0A834XEZ7_9FABA|nr:uncharacterized protein G2W53_001115 [Senna tora]
MTQPLPTECESASTSRKRKRRSVTNDVIDGFKVITVPFLCRLDKIADRMDMISREKALDEKREPLEVHLCGCFRTMNCLNDGSCRS